MKSQYWVLCVLGVVAASYYFWRSFDSPSPSRLATRALSASDSKERLLAVADLSMMKDPTRVFHVQRVATESKDPDVQAMSLAALADLAQDRTSLPVFLSYLEHESLKVREPAFRGVLRLSGLSLENIEFQPDASTEVRGPALRKLQELCGELQTAWANPMGSEAIAKLRGTAAVPPETPAVKTKDEAKEPVKNVPTPSLAPPAPGQLPGPMPLQDYSAMLLLVWVCRALGAVAVLAQVVSAAALLRGESEVTKKKKRTNRPVTEEEPIERTPAQTSAGLGPEFARLFNWVVYGVALFIVAELLLILVVRVDHTAVRIEQKLDYSPRGR